MKTSLKILFFLSLFMVLHSCSGDDDSEMNNNSTLAFTGTFNSEAFHFVGNQLQLEKNTDSVTEEVTYLQKSSYGDPLSTPTSTGIVFSFSFDEKPSFETLSTLNGQDLINNAGVQKPSLSIRVIKEGEAFYTDSAMDDIFEIEEVILVGDTPINYIDFDTGDLIGIKGKMEINDDNIAIKGDFILNLIELN